MQSAFPSGENEKILINLESSLVKPEKYQNDHRQDQQQERLSPQQNLKGPIVCTLLVFSNYNLRLQRVSELPRDEKRLSFTSFACSEISPV